MLRVPFLDARAAYAELQLEIDAAVDRVLHSGQYILGPEVENFEQDYAAYCGAKYAVGVGNGLDALVLALRAVGVSVGHEVIVPANTFIATWLAVSQCGAIPVPVDIDWRTQNVDSVCVKAAISSRTRAIIPVHLFGQPCEMDSLLQVAQEYRLNVIEDAAQAHGARYRGIRIGAHSDMVCWSFYPGKNLGAMGDGGAITTNNKHLYHKLRMLRNYGSEVKYRHDIQGCNSRLDPIQAAILGVKLKWLDTWNERRRKIASLYLDALEETDLTLPHVMADTEPVWHLFVIRHPRRDMLQKELGKSGVETFIHYPIPPGAQTAYKGFLGTGPDVAPLSMRASRENLSLPIGPHTDMSQANHVIESIKSALAHLDGVGGQQ
jgi:dTDP-4-amino-4,6-dideoxygalactose transaminase